MQAKLFEVRDRATFIPVLAVQLDPHTGSTIAQGDANEYLLARSGYGRHAAQQMKYVILTRLAGGEANYDPMSWGGSNTMVQAHSYIADHWNELMTGDVIDCEHLRGETTVPKRSERAGA